MSRLIKIVESKRNAILEEIRIDDEIGKTSRFFIENDVEIYNDVISDIKKHQLNDRFFLEEAIFRNISNWDNAEEYTTVLLHDWFYEMVRDNPLTEQERKDYLESTGWDADFLESAYFSSEKQLAYYLENKEIIEDYSIEDITTDEK